MQRMNETEAIKDYANKLLSIANKVRLLGSNFPDSRVVQKILVTLPENFEATTTSLENSKDVSSITLAELLNSLPAQEQIKRLIRQEGAVLDKSHNSHGNKSKKNKNHNKGEKSSNFNNKSGSCKTSQDFAPCSHYKNTNHSLNKCWWRPYAN